MEYSLSTTMEEVLNIVNNTMGLLSDFKELRDKKNKSLSLEEEKKDTKMQSTEFEIGTGHINQVEEEKKEEVNN